MHQSKQVNSLGYMVIKLRTVHIWKRRMHLVEQSAIKVNQSKTINTTKLQIQQKIEKSYQHKNNKFSKK